MNEIKEKTEYCLNCKIKPCSEKGCPLNNNIPEFIEQVKPKIALIGVGKNNKFYIMKYNKLKKFET